MTIFNLFHCQLCLTRADSSICLACESDLPWVKQTCHRCGRAHEGASVCKPCQEHRTQWDMGFFPLLYEAPIAGFIHGLKFKKKLHQARVLSELFVSRLPRPYGPRNDDKSQSPRYDGSYSLPQCLLPVPLHPIKHLWRGFNQSIELTRLLSQALGIPYCSDALKRTQFTRAQRLLTKKARLGHLKDAFQVTRPLPFEHIALVDDVMTTGETLNALVSKIRQSTDVKRIDVWTIAQTPLRP